jgi:hypothetical protein
MRRLLVCVMLVGILPVPAFAEASHPRLSVPPEAGIRSDFNGDGYSDLAVGIQRKDVDGLPEAGAVSVLYGSESGVQAEQPDDQLWTQDSLGVKGQTDGLERFGCALAAGDFNGDGYADLAIGAFGDGGGEVDYGAGSVEVLYGSAQGLQASAPDDQLWTQDSPGIEGQAEGHDFFGWSLATGDFNGDAFRDLAIGVQGEDGVLAHTIDAGAVNVLYGSVDGLQAESPQNQFWSEGIAGVKGTPGYVDLFGYALAGGDFDADGYEDLAIGVHGKEVGRRDGAGAVNILFGSPSGLQATSPDDQLWSQESAGVRDVAERGDGFGITLAAGDFNGDTYVDLSVGAEYEGKDFIYGGIVQILYGSPTGPQASSPDDQLWSQASPSVKDRFEANDWFGRSMTAADFNADSFGDLVIGVNENNSGAAVVLYGSPDGLQASSPDDQLWSQASPGVKDEPEGDGFAAAVSAGDFNGDGVEDLAVGVPFEHAFFPGAVSILYGSSRGIQADTPDDQLWSEASPGVKGQPEEDDNFGLSLLSG